MKRLKRTVVYVLAAVLGFSLFFQNAPAFAGEKTEELKELPVSVREGKESIERKDGEKNAGKAALEEPLSTESLEGTFREIQAAETGYQIAFYKTMTDTGENGEELTSAAAQEETGEAAAPPEVRDGGETIYLDTGEKVYYHDYYTHWFHVDGRYAYCLEPRKTAPSDGYYKTTVMEEGLLRKAMYYVLGGPGYETYRAAFGNIGAVEWSEDSEYAMSHCIVSYCYTGDMDAFFGTPDNLKEELLWEIRNIESLPDPPGSFKAFYFNVDGRGQTMGGCWDLQKGSIELQKASGNPQWTEDNPAYGSLAGAEYGVYAQGTDEQAAMLITDENGYARAEDLPEGNYDIRELKAPSGYALDTATETVTVTGGQTVTYSCQDIPQSNPAAILLEKADGEEEQRKSPDRVSLANAEFTIKYYKGIYDTDPSLQGIDPERTWIMKTNEDGVVPFDEKAKISGDDFYYMPNGNPTLPLGTVTIQETKAPAGYLLNSEIFICPVTSDGTEEIVETYNRPVVLETSQKGVIRLQKTDSEKGEAQGQASLEGAVYEIRNSSNEVVNTITTDKEGKGESEKLPLGTYTVKEKTPSPGYQTDPQTYSLELTAEDSASEVFYKTVASREEIIRGGVRVAKWSIETNERKPQGSAVLKGGRFTITNCSANAVLVDGRMYDPGEVIATVETEENGLWTSAEDWLPYGTYQVAEVQAPDGYLPDGAETRTFQIREEGKIVSLDHKEGAIQNQIKRGDLKFVKVADGTLERLANVPFKITSKTTGESHIVVSDINGQVDTSSAWNPHSQNTNRGETSKDGLWFSGTTDKEVPVNDEKGALPYDTYRIEEQRCEENKGYKLLSVEITIYRDHYTIPLGTLTDDSDLAEIRTTAMDSGTEGHYAPAGKNTTIIDTVAYANLQKGEEYTLKGTLMNQETGEPVTDDKGNPVTAQKTFSAKKPMGSVEMEFTFDSSRMAGADVVVFEELYLKENLITDHKDITDEDQTIHFPEISTKAMDQETNANMAKADEEAALTDEVSYKNLQPKKKYRLLGTLMDKISGKPAKDAEGKEIKAETSFKPEAPDGTVKVNFTFDASALAGKQVVVYEELYSDGHLIGEHKDICDEGQTVTFPRLHTNAADSITGNHTGTVSGKAAVVDTVTYAGLLPEKEYTVKGTLINKETGEPVKDGKGKEITEEKSFTPEKAEGSIEMVYELDSTLLHGQTVVAFEKLLYNGAEVAAHADIHDEAQSVHYPDLKTQAKDKETGLQEGTRKEQTVIADTVTYQNLIPGQEYTLKGILMNKSTGTPLLINEKEVTGEKTFTPEKAEGAVVLEFSFDSTALKSPEIVVFESLYVKDKEVNAHRDLKDKNQTVSYPEHKTEIPVENKEPEPQEAPAGSSGTASVKTGDEGPVAELFCILVFAGAVTALAVRRRRNP